MFSLFLCLVLPTFVHNRPLLRQYIFLKCVKKVKNQRARPLHFCLFFKSAVKLHLLVCCHFRANGGKFYFRAASVLMKQNSKKKKIRSPFFRAFVKQLKLLSLKWFKRGNSLIVKKLLEFTHFLAQGT